jgi:hypothetical protein
MVGSMKLDLVAILWADAHSDSSGWTGIKETHEDGEYIVHSVGWLIPENLGGKSGHVTICQSFTPDEDVDHVLHIPTGMVREMKTTQIELLGYGHGH